VQDPLIIDLFERFFHEGRKIEVFPVFYLLKVDILILR